MKKAERLNQELIYLRDKSAFNVQDLMAEFKISKRTALRDVEELEDMGLPYYVAPGRYGGYRLIKQQLLTSINFNVDEINAIFYAIRSLEKISETPFDKSFSQIRDKLLATLPEGQQQQLDKLLSVLHYWQTAPVKENLNLALIAQQIIAEKALELTDTQYGSKRVQVQFNELFYRDGIWFASGINYQNDMWGTYRVDYFENVVALDVQRYTLIELNQRQEVYESTYHNQSFRIEVTQFGQELFLRHHYPNMQLISQDSQYYIVGGYNQSELNYMAHYLVGFGTEIKSISPEPLRQKYVDVVAEMLKRQA
ncbi:WYL domain-containing protein [Weissella diestrammenae]|uniref:WYL domain-containing protein n=1 Tax=Weissella diestrammenae TaxID=1162633 RepID=A0A7G9T580_9LACO|nr:WYL domain-containing protein [Weissella diestrammenae]MCM0583110.1 WYL domain-containing protein [Weissella diestrammenae]QNN75255.1 WYL domain-containing protein [Weissella diestrammenae]